MADRAPAEVATDDPETALYRRLNFFPTPPWASRAGAELVKSLDPRARSVIDPCAGMGHMADALAEAFERVEAIDVHDYGRGYPLVDWCDPAWPRDAAHDWMIANPPFSRAEEFVRLGLRRARRGVAVLARLAFIESVGRYDLMQNNLSVFAPFSERVPMVLGRWDPEVGTATAHAWFVWLKPGALGFECDAAAWRRPQVLLFPPGTRDRLWRPTDPATYGKLSPARLEEQRTAGGQPDLLAQAS